MRTELKFRIPAVMIRVATVKTETQTHAHAHTCIHIQAQPYIGIHIGNILKNHTISHVQTDTHTLPPHTNIIPHTNTHTHTHSHTHTHTHAPFNRRKTHTTHPHTHAPSTLLHGNNLWPSCALQAAHSSASPVPPAAA
jgi:hypothetical protein